MRLKRALLAFLVVFAAAGEAPAAEPSEERARLFVDAMADRAVVALTGKELSRRDRVERFRQLFKENFAIEAIGTWILGRHWRLATPAEQKEYLSLFEDLVVVSYVDRFAEYTGETLRITKTAPVDQSTVVVFSEIVRPAGGPPVRIDWRVAGKDSQLKVVDVVVEGTSMSATMRSDFASIIRQRGGTVEGLLAELRAKTAGLRRDLGG